MSTPPSILELNARRGPAGRRLWVVSALAAAGVFATVLASQTVYGQPQHRGQRSTSSALVEIESANTSQASSQPRARATAAASAEGKLHAREPAAREAKASPEPATVRDATAPDAAVARRDAAGTPERHDESVRIAMHSAVAPAADAPADDPGSEPTATDAPAGDVVRDRRRAPGKRTVIQDEFLVEGKLEKPSAYYVLRRSSLDYDWARLDAKFSPLVLESVQDPLF
jgi:hypothetical protein